MTPKQTLAAHIGEMHNAQRGAHTTGMTYKEMQRWHADQHHRYYQNHHHGPSRGPDDRPAGWRTGENAVPIARRSH